MSETNIPKPVASLYLELGEALLSAKRYGEAIEALNRAMTEDLATDSDKAAASRLLTRVEAERVSEQLKEVSQAVRNHPTSQSASPSPSPARSGGAGGIFEMLSSFKGLFSKETATTVSSTVWTEAKRRAIRLLDDGKYTEAETWLRGLRVLLPKDSEVAEYLGRALLRQGKFDESVEVLEKSLQPSGNTASFYSCLGEVYGRLGRTPAAADLLKKSLDMVPDDPGTLRIYGVVTRSLGRFADSAEALEKAIEKDPRNEAGYLELANTLEVMREPGRASKVLCAAANQLLESNQYDEAEGLIRQATTLDSSSELAWRRLGIVLLLLNRRHEYLSAFQRAVEIKPSSENISWLAWAHMAQGSQEVALGLTERALAEGDPDFKQFAVLLKAAILNRLGRTEEANATVSSAFKEHPDQLRPVLSSVVQKWPDEYLFFLLGKTAYDADDWTAAADALNKVLEQDPDHLEGNRYYGYALRRLGKDAEAVSYLQLVIDLGSSHRLEATADHLQTVKELGEALAALRRYREAYSVFQNALSLHPREPWLLSRAGDALRLQGKFSEALKYLTQARELTSLSDTKQRAWVLSREGETLRILNRNDEALSLVQQALDIDPGDGWTWGVMGSVRSNLEQYRSAIEAFDRATEINNNDAWSYGYKGLVLRFGRRFEAARVEYLRSLSLEPAAWVLVEDALALREKPEPDFEGAIAELRKAIDVDPNYAWGCLQLSASFYLKQEFADAKLWLEKSQTLDPDVSGGAVLRALILDHAGSKEEAEAAHKAALKGQDAQSYLDRAGAYSALYEYERARVDYERAIELDKNLAEAYNDLAWMYVDSLEKELDKAFELSTASLEMASTIPEARRGSYMDTLGWILFKMKRYAEALDHLEKAREMNPESLVIEDHRNVCTAVLKTGGFRLTAAASGATTAE